jgi:hypothetical protein
LPPPSHTVQALLAALRLLLCRQRRLQQVWVIVGMCLDVAHVVIASDIGL